MPVNSQWSSVLKFQSLNPMSNKRIITAGENRIRIISRNRLEIASDGFFYNYIMADTNNLGNLVEIVTNPKWTDDEVCAEINRIDGNPLPKLTVKLPPKTGPRVTREGISLPLSIVFGASHAYIRDSAGNYLSQTINTSESRVAQLRYINHCVNANAYLMGMLERALTDELGDNWRDEVRTILKNPIPKP